MLKWKQFCRARFPKRAAAKTIYGNHGASGMPRPTDSARLFAVYFLCGCPKIKIEARKPAGLLAFWRKRGIRLRNFII